MTGHGWVTPLPNGARARCGGPGLCKLCSVEAAQAIPALRVEIERQRDLIERAGILILPLSNYAREFRSLSAQDLANRALEWRKDAGVGE